MKRNSIFTKGFHLTLAAAAVAAISMPAAAQNVEIYGIADVGIATTNFKGDTVHSSDGTTTAIRENRSGRWGIRGSEKLGGGLQVIFRLEGDVDFGTGQIDPTDAAAPLFGRQAWVGFKSDYGTMRVGRTKGLFDDLSEEIDPFRNDGIVGDFTKRAWRVNVAESRVSNSVTYEAPKFAGLEVKAQYSMDETADKAGNPGWSVSGLYQLRDLTVIAAYDRPTLTKAGAQPEAWLLGVAYQFGPVKLSASYNSGDMNDSTSTTSATKVEGYTVGAAWEIGNGIVKGVWSKMDTNVPVAKWSHKVRDMNVFGLGYDYPLSKRTTLYAMTVYETEGQRPVKTFIEGTTKGAQVGITHRF